MNQHDRIRRNKVVAWIIAVAFLLGFFVNSIGSVTGTVLGAWFVGTQRLRRGFAWMLGFALLFGLPHWWRSLPLNGVGTVLAYTGWTLLAAVVSVLPFTLYRVIGARLTGFAVTLSLPVFAVVFATAQQAWLPVNAIDASNGTSAWLFPQLARMLGANVQVFFTCWFAAVVVWAWNREFRVDAIRPGVAAFAVAWVLAMVADRAVGGVALSPRLLPFRFALDGLCFVAAAAFLLRALLKDKVRGWTCDTETMAILQSPVTGEPLKLVSQGREQALMDPSGDRFGLLDGMPDLRCQEDMTGDNEKYNHLYEFIGGFYDDVQRVGCALAGIDRDAYVMSYLGSLEVKPGDRVLETSVGTGLNFKYLPRGVKLVGIDLSPEMLINCRTNLQRWQMEADLLVGNAERLPFADASFDVVFHVGGINFFNDRGQAIREMVRVARPGSRILIADETEEHVKAAYERGPITDKYYRNRKEPVKPPVDLLPEGMLETHVEILNVVGKNRFYALTFRKPWTETHRAMAAS